MLIFIMEHQSLPFYFAEKENKEAIIDLQKKQFNSFIATNIKEKKLIVSFTIKI